MRSAIAWMSNRDPASGRARFFDTSASAERRMEGAFATMVPQGIAFSARSHGTGIPLA